MRAGVVIEREVALQPVMQGVTGFPGIIIWEILQIHALALFEIILANVEHAAIRFNEIVPACIKSKTRQQRYIAHYPGSHPEVLRESNYENCSNWCIRWCRP
jgi:hypothetical protein